MDTLPALIGEDPAFLGLLDHVKRLAQIDRPCVILGERGAGKELIAARLHYLSPHWQGPFVKVNCAALSDSLLDSELFGHEAGAFTGAQKRRLGRFERARGGTLFLDEIATASPSVQEKLLRAVEYGEIERIGGEHIIQVDVRVIGATNQDLVAMGQTGDFRADLLDRLAFDVVHVPALRDRPLDIPLLARHFALSLTKQLDRPVFPGFSPAAMARLADHAWPGNIRELRNTVERAVYYHDDFDHPIDTFTLNPFAQPGQPTLEQPKTGFSFPISFADQVAGFERELLTKALQQAGHRQTETAKLLGLGYHQCRRLLKKYGL